MYTNGTMHIQTNNTVHANLSVSTMYKHVNAINKNKSVNINNEHKLVKCNVHTQTHR